MKKHVSKRRWMLGTLLLLWVVAFSLTPLCADARTIKIGILGPMNFVQGDHAWKGAQIALDEIKAAGGIKVGGVKMPVEFVKVDTNEILSLSNATSAVEKAITRDKVDFLVGGCSSGAILAMQEVAADHKKIFLTAGSGSHPEITNRVGTNYERYKYFFRALGRNAGKENTIQVMFIPSINELAQIIRKQTGVEKVKLAMLFEQAQWLEPQIAVWRELIPKVGVEVVGLWRMSISALDVSAQLTDIREKGAHIILSMTSGPVAIPLYRQVGELEIPAAIVGINVEAEGAKFYEATGGYCAYGGVSTQGCDVAMSFRTRPFYREFEKRYGERVTLTASAYDSILMIKEAVEKAASLDADKVVMALEKIDFQSTHGRMVFDKNHDPMFGPGYLTGCAVQWLPGGKLSTWWPHDYEGVQVFQLSPWMVKYWKSKK